jgi:hypothetical protein
MLAVPTATPDTTPVETPIVATAGLLLAHVPPAVLLVSVVVLPTQVNKEPPIADGAVTNVSVTTAVQPEDVVYVTDTRPAAEGVTTPEVDTVAILVGVADQVPPATDAEWLMVPGIQTR